MYKPHLLGKIGEVKAVKFLKANKYKILKTNFKNSVGEIDIIALKKKHYFFVEVKTKSTLEYGLPQEEVTKAKQIRIRKGALEFLRLRRILTDNIHFDVIEILGEEINHIQDAFY